ncbi:MAG TPA: sigma-70 family RNA polymerase sigma factor, partial [Planctomycetota bacterium]|nr:sigma-70 family RNA polymerase sigma factor [Planctomycetota bacterium]
MMVHDAALLERYARTRDAEAFAELVRRHAGAVYGTCLRITRNPHDAEDAAQECFLELARRASSITSSVPGWLHTAATSRSLNAIRDASTRRRHEEQAMNGNHRNDEPAWDEIAPLVDAALEDLPDDLRVPLVLHFLEGRSQQEIAGELGVNQSTVSRRIDSGLGVLRERLKKAGVAVSAAVLASLIAENAASAAPATLAAALGKMAMAGIGETAGAAATGSAAAASAASTAAASPIFGTLVAVAAAVVIVAFGIVAYKSKSGSNQNVPAG